MAVFLQYLQGHPFYMATLSCSVIVLFVGSAVLGQPEMVPQYGSLESTRSTIPKIFTRSLLTDPQLAQLLLARKQAIKIAKDVDSEIQTLLQEKAYRRTFQVPDYNLDGQPFFNPNPANTLSAVIGAQAGSWFPGPSGAGIEGSRMLEGRASHLNGRMPQDDSQRTDQTKGAWFPDPSGADIMAQGRAEQLNYRRTQDTTQQRVGTWFQNPLSTGVYDSRLPQVRVNQLNDRRPQDTTQRPVQRGTVPSRLQKATTIRVLPQGQKPEINSRAFAPTTAHSTKDPSDEVEKLGNPQQFNEKCLVLKLTFEKTNGSGVALDDSPQKNSGKFEGEASVMKDEEDLGRAVKFGSNGKIVLDDDFKGKPRKSVAVSMWVRLDSIRGTVPLITATDETNFVRYDLLLRNGKGEWVHRVDSGRELFRVQSSSPDVTAGQWHNIVGSYDSETKSASLWVDGKQVSRKDGINGMLSQKWNKLTIFGGTSRGEMDNIFMFRCPLDKTKIVALYVSDASHKDVKRDVVMREQRS